MSHRRLLEIYLAPICFGLETACDLTGTDRALALSGVEVRLIDQSAPDAIRWPAVFADIREHG